MTIHKEGRTLLFVLLIRGHYLVADYFLQSKTHRNIVIGVCVVFYLIVLSFPSNFHSSKNPKQVMPLLMAKWLSLKRLKLVP